MNVRKAQLSDSEFVYRVKKEALGGYIEDTWGWDEAFQYNYHLNSYEPSSISIYSTPEQGDIGYAELDIGEKHMAITGIYILEEFQNHGAGTVIIKSVLKDAAEKDLPVRLRVLRVNLKASRLYERLGFRLEGESETHFTMVHEA